ncbi:MAG: hypothetical protein QOD92_3246 [Acidimicrobiaceae bacterium]|jgi:MFS family permease
MSYNQASLRSDRPRVRELIRPLLAYLTGLLPLFLASVLAPDLRADLGFSASELGISAATFFAAGALASGPLGMAAERLGAGRSLRAAAAVSAVSMCAIAIFATSWAALTGILAIAGMGQSLTEPAANLYLARTIDTTRLGFAFGIKQAATPAVALLAGVAVPLVAVPFGWRWCFAGGALVAGLAVVSVPWKEPPSGAPTGENVRVAAFGSLVILATGMGFASAAATSILAYAVDSAASSGLSTGYAAALAALGGLMGVCSRVVSGLRADRRGGGDLRVVSRLLGVGAGAYLLFATGSSMAFVIAIPIAYVTAWGWPGLLHLAVVRRNPNAPSAATGIVMTGACVGAVAGPLIFGALVDHVSYGFAWCGSGLAATAGAVTIAVADHVMPGPR